MIYLILALLFLSVLHFVYEMIVASSLRSAARLRLFALRDELRALKARGELEGPQFRDLQDSLNALINSLDAVNLRLLLRWERLLQQDAAFRARVEARLKAADAGSSPAADRIRTQSVHIALEVLAINCAGGLLYLAPLVFVLRGFSRIKDLVRSLASIPEADWSRVRCSRPMYPPAEA